jgi:hypothetical protein
VHHQTVQRFERALAYGPTAALDDRPRPGKKPTIYGTVSLLAGIDLLTGQVHALVRDRHRSREFIEFLKLVDAEVGYVRLCKDGLSRRERCSTSGASGAS